MIFRRILITSAILLCTSSSAFAALQIGSTTKQASFAASTTQELTAVLGNLVDDSGVMNSSWTSSQSGIWQSISSVFLSINNWLKEKASVDFLGILLAIWHAFLFVIHFIADLIRKLLL